MEIRVLAADDDPVELRALEAFCKKAGGIQLESAASARETFQILEARTFDLVLLDLDMGDQGGPVLVSSVLGAAEGALVAMLTGDDSPVTIVDCIKRGAFDYLTKPVSSARLEGLFRHVRFLLELKAEPEPRPPHMPDVLPGGMNPAFSAIITRSPLMHGMFRVLERIAPSSQPVLVTGESGSGKELVARAIHRLSGRPGCFVPVNAAGLDENLFIDTLFGHRKGAYTGAVDLRRGLAREAEGGTLFLDEIGDLGGDAQVKLLRFLQDGEYYPLGADRPERSSARVLMATNADLPERVREGKFRADLYYRLMTHHVALPPLRTRKEDIPLLVSHFIQVAAADLGQEAPQDWDEFVAALMDWDFPGNVRELYALVQGALCREEGGRLPASYAREHFQTLGLSGGALQGQASPLSAPLPAALAEQPGMTMEELTDRYIRLTLDRCGGNQSRAARILGISQSTISRRMGMGPMNKA